MKTKIGILAVLLTGLAPMVQAAGPRPVDIASLLEEMVDRDSPARWPQPAYTLKEATSYDRRKTDPANPATWHTNFDHEQFIRTETNEGRREWVIMDASGPGAITRFWTPLSKNALTQTIRFYLDGSAKPSLAVNYFDLLSGKGIARPPFAFVARDQTSLADELKPDYGRDRRLLTGVGGDLYLPIPFARSCKVTLDSVPFYYGINYRIYAAGTTVKTFSLEGLDAAKAVVERVGNTLLAQPSTGAGTATREVTLAPAASLDIPLPSGPAAVRTLRVRIDPADAPRALRSTILEATFDGEPCVWCSLGEFFGAGAQIKPVRDWDRTVEQDGTLTAQWVMPYQTSGTISLRNVCNTPVKIMLSAATAPWTWDARSMHFHASWRSQHDIPTRPRSDWNYIEIAGKGVYVGDTLTVFSPAKEWYGEGDERIFLDGEKVPSMIGTGTEDYYGYAWGMTHYFSSPFMSAPLRDGVSQNDWRGYTTDSRLRLLDGIPFTTHLKHDMEIWNWAETKVDYAAGLFWYALPGATSNRQPQPDEAGVVLKSKPADKP